MTRFLAVLAVLAGAGTLVACSGDDDAGGPSSTGSRPVPSATSTGVAATSVVDTSSPPSTPAPSVIEDVEALGGTVLYTVDLRNGAAAPVGTVGAEVGVLGVTAVDEGQLLGLTDVPDLAPFSGGDPAMVGDRVPVAGVEGSTLLALDGAVDGTLFAIGDAGVLVTLDPGTGVATPVVGGAVPVADPGIGFDVDPPSGQLVLTDAGGTHQLVDPRTAAVTTLPAMAYAAGDPNAGTVPRIVAVAVAGDSSRFAIDAGTASLVQLGADGVLTTVGPLGLAVTDGASFDIAFDGTAYLTSPG